MSKATIGIIDYNTGNLQSVKNALIKINIKASLVSKPEDINKYDKIILPGVGSFGDAMTSLKKSNLDKSIKEFAKNGKHILGICLGSQVLFEKGYEFGKHEGLSLINGEVVPFDKTKIPHLKIPHMGWNKIRQNQNPLFKKLDKEIYCYFVHSFHIKCEQKYIIGSTNYGYNFASVINKDNIFGMQPHPEKSHDNGLQILKNFCEL